MVRLVQLTALQEAFEDEEQRPQLRILFQKLFDQLDAVDSILPVKTDVDIDRGQLVLQFDDGDLRMLNRLD